jgi:hypothetical protein
MLLATIPLDLTRQRTLADVLFLPTTNGTRCRATHAILKPIERDCIVGPNPRPFSNRVYISNMGRGWPSWWPFFRRVTGRTNAVASSEGTTYGNMSIALRGSIMGASVYHVA